MNDVDSQHEMLIHCMVELHGGIREKAGRERLEALMRCLAYHAMTHLAYEEEGMLALDYPARLEHLEQHKFFREKMSDFAERLHSESPMVATDLLVFLRDWFLGHIESEDVKYATFIRECRADGRLPAAS